LGQFQKTLVQCDFDGTVTEEDISFILLDAFAEGDWRQYIEEYDAGRITVGQFNSQVFGLVRADRQTLLDYVRDRAVVRPGFKEFAEMCHRNGYRLVIVSNGLQFYIEQILGDMGMNDVEVHASQTRFFPGKLRVEYIGPDGSIVDAGFKEVYTDAFLSEGYRVIYIGDGSSDYAPASLCHEVFAARNAGSLLRRCHEGNVECKPFSDFHDIICQIESR